MIRWINNSLSATWSYFLNQEKEKNFIVNHYTATLCIICGFKAKNMNGGFAAIFPFGEVYGLENISDAIKAATGHTPQVECESYKHIPLLSNIFLCFQYTATSIDIIDCPLITRCNFQAILFPYDLFGPS